MAITVLNNISDLTAEKALGNTSMNLQKTLTQLSTGLKINSGSDDAAGLSIANGMTANINALTQSEQNASNGVGELQTADGSLSQVTTLLNRAVTLATEGSASGLTTAQGTALNTEFQSILSEVDQIGSTTNFNGTAIFSTTASVTSTVYLSDGSSSGAGTISTTVGSLGATALGLTATTTLLSTTTSAQAALTAINSAISTISAQRGIIGASVNRLNAATSVMTDQVTNLQSAVNSVQNADIGTTVANMTQYNVLESTGMAALQQANQAQQAVLKLVQ